MKKSILISEVTIINLNKAKSKFFQLHTDVKSAKDEDIINEALINYAR